MPSAILQLRQLSERMEARERGRSLGEDALAAFVQSVPLPAWVKDKNGMMLYINEHYTRAYGVSPQDYIGRTDAEVWGRETAERFRANDLAVMESGLPYYAVEPVHNVVTGRQQFLDVLKFPLLLDGSLLGIAGIVTGYKP